MKPKAKTPEWVRWFLSKEWNLKAFLHFSERLKERHGIQITIVEYIDFCFNTKFYKIGRSKDKKGRDVGYIFYGKRQIHVVKSKSDGVLITVLPRYAPYNVLRDKNEQPK